MSWQATAYVKSLTHGITAYEKLLLFVLADYHNTHRGAAWPSVALLAQECLMTERNCFNLLKALEDSRDGHPGGIIRRRKTGLGRGSITEYAFVELSEEPPRKHERVSSFDSGKGELKRRKGERKDEYGDSAIRKEECSRRTIKSKTLPNPPAFAGGNLTVRDRRKLNERIHHIMGQHLDSFGHAAYDGRGAKLQPVEFSEAVEMACAQMLIPIDAAWEAIRAAGLGDAKKLPEAVTA